MRNLMEQIEFLREKLINLSLIKGFGHPDVLRVSQELDVILNKYQEKTILLVDCDGNLHSERSC